MPESPEVLLQEVMAIYFPKCSICGGLATREITSSVLLGARPKFCDNHGAGDSKQCQSLSEVGYLDIEYAYFVRRCLSLRRCSSVLPECAYHAAAEGLCQVVNERVNKNLREGSTWVRVTPPSQEELGAISGGAPRLMPFTRVGSLATLVSIYHLSGDGTRMVDVLIGGDTVVFEFEAFTRAFVRAVSQDEWQLDKMEAFQ